jgi:predicted RNA-binding protein with PUA domain
MINIFLFSQLPFDVIREILLYDDHFVIRKQYNTNTLICINKIPKIDKRFILYDTIPKIYELTNNNWSVILGKNKRFIISHSLRPSLIWEYSFSTFSKDKHTNIICSIPDSVLPLYN